MTLQDAFDTNPTQADASDTSEHRKINRGNTLGRYVIIEPIGSGGMGAIYRAYDPELNRGVALKILSVTQTDHQAAETAKTRLIREAQALAQLSHPNVVAVHDVGTFGDDVFIAMELVEGQTLSVWMKKNKKPIKEILQILAAAGQGLSAAHKAGLVHRDFKPDNVIVGDDGRVRVLDFGLARAVDEGPEPNTSEMEADSNPNLLTTPLTHEGGVVGTPLYMAPEQHLGHPTDERTDQFAFCLVLYEALYGKRPFYATTMRELKKAVLRQQINSPPNDTDVPAWLWKIIHKGLSVEAQDRFPTLEILLEKLRDDPEEAKASQRTRRLLVVLIFLVAILPFGVWSLFFRGGDLCTGAIKKTAGIWNEKSTEAVRKAFIKTKIPYAQSSFDRTANRLAEYLHKWTQEHTEVCEATQIRGEQSEEIMDLKMGCLNNHLRNVNALINVFAQADKTVVAKSVQAVLSLPGISNCSDGEALRARVTPPKDEQTRDRVDAIREKLVEVEALRNTGKYGQGLKLAQQIMTEAGSIDYKPIRAEALYWLGCLLDRTGKFKQAEQALLDAARLAGESKNTLLVAKAMVWLIAIVGYQQARHDAGLVVAQDAEIILVVAGGDDMLQAQIFNSKGAIFFGIKDYDKALEYYHKSLATRNRVLGPEHYTVAPLLNNMGLVAKRQGKHRQALEFYQRALKISENSLGKNHPDVAKRLTNICSLCLTQEKFDAAIENCQRSLNIYEMASVLEHPDAAYNYLNIGLAYWNKKGYLKSLRYLEKALAIFEEVLGKDHPAIAWPVYGLGRVHLEMGKANAAQKSLERVRMVCEDKKCDVEPHGTGLFVLARIRADSGDKAEAIELAKQARKIFAQVPKIAQATLDEIDAWLGKNGSDDSAS